MTKTFKVEIKPTTKQKQQFAKAFGTRRWVYNWGLAKSEELYEQEQKTVTNYDLDPMLNELRANQPEEFGWIGEVNTMVKAEALKDLGLSLKAYRKLLSQVKRKPSKNFNPNKGRPRFKKRGVGIESFRLNKKTYNTFLIESNYHLNFNWTRAEGRLSVKTCESLEFLKSVDIKLMTISLHAGRYFMSLVYEKTNHKPNKEKKPAIGLDLGIKHSAATFDGSEVKIFDLPKSIEKYEKLRDQRKRKLSAKQGARKGEDRSKNFEKQKLLLDKTEAKIARIRKDFLHKLSTYLCENYTKILIDDFSFKGFISRFDDSNSRKKAYRVAPCMLKEMLEVKAPIFESNVDYVKIGTPTTQTCSNCGVVKTEANRLTLADRKYECACGFVEDRDINAAINVYKLIT